MRKRYARGLVAAKPGNYLAAGIIALNGRQLVAVVLLKGIGFQSLPCSGCKHLFLTSPLLEPIGVEPVIGVFMSTFGWKRLGPCVFAVSMLALPFAAYAQRPQNRMPRSQAVSENANVPAGGIKGRVVAVDSGQGIRRKQPE